MVADVGIIPAPIVGGASIIGNGIFRYVSTNRNDFRMAGVIAYRTVIATLHEVITVAGGTTKIQIVAKPVNSVKFPHVNDSRSVVCRIN